MSSIVRQLKLRGLVGNKVSIDPIIGHITGYFDNIFDGMCNKIIPEYSEMVDIFHKGPDCYFMIDVNNNVLWCRSSIWDKLTETMGLTVSDSYCVIQYIVREHSGYKCSDMYVLQPYDLSKIEEKLYNHLKA